MLRTESPSDEHVDLDLYPTHRLVQALVDDQRQALWAVQMAATDLARAVDAATPRIGAGGRLIYVRGLITANQRPALSFTSVITRVTRKPKEA